jgi:hypothetical protein
MEITGRLEPRLHGAVEAQVDLEFSIGGAIEQMGTAGHK